MVSILSPFECTTGILTMSLEEIKLSVIVMWIFYESDFSRLFMMFFRYNLISSMHSLIGRVLFLLLLLSCSISLFLQKVPALTGL